MTKKSETNFSSGGKTINNEVSVPDSLKESVSALMDGEATEMEIHRVLKATETNSTVTDLWSRYQAVSSSIRNSAPQAPMMDLSAAIRASIENDDTFNSGRKNWFSGFLKAGIAASVAVVMVLTAQLAGLQNNGIDSTVGLETQPLASVVPSAPASMNSPVSLPAGFQPPTINARVVSSQTGMPARETQPRYYPVVTQAQTSPSSSAPSLEVQAYLQRVMEVHAGNAALNSGRGLLPYARVPGSTSDQP